MTVYRRRQAGLQNTPWVIIFVRTGLVAVATGFVIEWADTDRGLPWVTLIMLVLLVGLTFLSTRTRFGRHVYAVGGNAEAARRAGVNVAASGSRVRALSHDGGARRDHPRLAPQLGGHEHRRRHDPALLDRRGGDRRHHLFGGRGAMKSALLGAIVIAMIDNGLGLLNVSAGAKYIVTGIVLLAAVTLDSLSRRRSAAAGRV